MTFHFNVRLVKASRENDGKCALGKLTYAVAYPRAVVIKLGDASIAHGTVFRSDGLPYLWSTGRKMRVLCAMETNANQTVGLSAGQRARRRLVLDVF